MGAKVELVVTAREANAINTWLKIHRAQDTAEKQLRRISQGGEHAGQQIRRMGGQAVRSIGRAAVEFAGLATILGGIYVAARALRREWEFFLQQRRDASQSYPQFAAQYETIEAALGGPGSAAKYEDRIRQIVGTAGLEDPTHAQRMIVAALSARGAVGPEKALDVAYSAARLGSRFRDPQMMFYTVQSVLDILNTMSEKERAAADPDAILGAVIGAFQGVRVVEPRNLTQNLMRGVAQVMRQHGATFAEGMGLAGAIGSAIVDPEGRQTATALSNLAQRLMEEFPQASAEIAPLRQYMGRWKTMSLMERIRWTRGEGLEGRELEASKMYRAWLLGPMAMNPEVARYAQVFGVNASKLVGEMKTREAQRALLAPGDPLASRVWSNYQEIAKRVSNVDSARAKQIFEGFVSPAADTPRAQTQEVIRSFRGQQAAMKTLDIQAIRAAQQELFNLIEENAKLLGKSWHGMKFQQLKVQLEAFAGERGVGPVEVLQRAAELADETANQIVSGDYWKILKTDEFASWLEGRRPDLAHVVREYQSGEFARQKEALTAGFQQRLMPEFHRYRFERMAAEDVQALKAWLEFKRQLRDALMRAGEAPPSTRPTSEPGGFWRFGVPQLDPRGFWERSLEQHQERQQQRRSQEKGTEQQKSLEDKLSENTKAVQGLTNALAGHGVTVTVEDAAGRQVTRATNRRRPVPPGSVG